MSVNIGPQDSQLLLTTALPAAGANVTTAVLDMQGVDPMSSFHKLGRFVITFPALPENNTGAGITVAMQTAAPSLTNSPPAPQLPVPGAFAAPAVAQTLTVASVAGTGSAAGQYYMTPAFDTYGSCFQFYQFLITVPAGVVTQGENITVAWVFDGV
jgi:hypothetical protein